MAYLLVVTVSVFVDKPEILEVMSGKADTLLVRVFVLWMLLQICHDDSDSSGAYWTAPSIRKTLNALRIVR